MSDQGQAAVVPKPKPRAAGDNRYPLYDLNACIALAKKVKDEGGNDCTPEQLGALLGYKNTNGGGFATRVSNAKMFGLIETVQGRYRITQRAETVLYSITDTERQQMLVEAFFAVPIYKRVYEMHKGTRLPEALGMQNLLHRQFGIPTGDRLVQALRVLMDSAEQAGFFRSTQGRRTNLVLPIIAPSAAPTDEATITDMGTRNGGTSGGSGGNGGAGGGQLTRGKLLDGMWEMLPNADSWTEAELQTWLKMLTMALRVRYRVPEPEG
jgi:hypothetical protein